MLTNIPADHFDVLAEATEAERAEHPFAIGVSLNGATTVFRFNNSGAADLYASLMDDDMTITRWVAVAGPEWSGVTPVPGWRLVTFFA